MAEIPRLPLSISYNVEQALAVAIDEHNREDHKFKDIIILATYENGEHFRVSSKMTRCESVYILEHEKLRAMGITD